jgi:hypothetical protein
VNHPEENKAKMSYIADEVRAFYDRHPYPPPVKDLDDHHRRWQDRNMRRADYHLYWPDPDAGLNALGSVLKPDGAMHLMVYATYGRTGIYMLQKYCNRLGIGRSDKDIRDLAHTLMALPPGHPLAHLLGTVPDFRTKAGLADALLHPQDRAYSVEQFFEFINRAGLSFGRWVRQAPYLP